MSRKKLPAAWLKTIVAPLRSLAVDIETLEADPHNARRHPERNRQAVRASLARFGQRLPLVVTGSRVLVGNLRLAVMREEGWKAVAVVAVPAHEAEAYAIADNRAAELAEWDDGRLAEVLADLELDGSADLLDALGFTDDEVEKILSETAGNLDDLERELGAAAGGAPDREPSGHQADTDGTPAEVEEIPDPPKRATTKLGQIIEFGSHRLFCGDSLEDDLAPLLDGDLVDLVVTDPPFAVFGSSTGVASDVADDRMVRPFFRSIAERVTGSLKLFGHAYVFCDWRTWPALHDSIRKLLAPQNLIVWDKGDFGLGANFRNCHELIGFLHRRPEQQSAYKAAATGVRTVHEPNVIRQNRTGQGGFESESEKGERWHNAAKPVDLVRRLIRYSSDEGETVLDLFGGAGSTLLAAELEGRAARLVEIDPALCDVIVQRWEKLTGTKAKRPRTKRSKP